MPAAKKTAKKTAKKRAPRKKTARKSAIPVRLMKRGGKKVQKTLWFDVAEAGVDRDGEKYIVLTPVPPRARRASAVRLRYGRPSRRSR